MDLSKLANAAGLETKPIDINQLFSQSSGVTPADQLRGSIVSMNQGNQGTPVIKFGKGIKAASSTILYRNNRRKKKVNNKSV